MSTLREIHLGESKLSERPKNRLLFKINKGSITTDKLSDEAVTHSKLSKEAVDYDNLSVSLQFLLSSLNGVEHIVIDQELSISSNNPVSNAVLSRALNKKLEAEALLNYITREELLQFFDSKIEVVDALPTENISDTTLYLLRPSQSEVPWHFGDSFPVLFSSSSEYFIQYIYQDGSWKRLGTKELDLSGYVRKTELEGQYQRKLTIDNVLNKQSENPIENGVVANALENKVDRTELEVYASKEYVTSTVQDSISSSLSSLHPHVTLTQEEYDALESKQNGTIYLIVQSSAWVFGDSFPVVFT